MVIKDLENEYWSCDTPIDNSKPVKKLKKIKDEIEIKKSEEIHKKRE